ncbi:hypothetical protein BWI17_21345 [Betaproteobacteria bacterium GR16-43]|nr:hypothetical protein BWI17_21345 [Betaproteobacteria bacterium GR16-43]
MATSARLLRLGSLLLVGMLMVSAALTGCGGDGGRDPVLGPPGIALAAPTVTAVVPINGATGVMINTALTAAFSTAMAPATINAGTFTVVCPTGSAIAGAVSYNAGTHVATFTPAANLPVQSLCTATITTGATDTAGIGLAANFVWSFTTGAAPDTTRPRVISTVPATTIPGPTPGVATNTAISATFSEDMAPGTLTTSSFTVVCAPSCVSPTGTVTYNVGNRTAVFMPAGALNAGTTYTATITTAATDLAGNALAGNQGPLPGASNYVWTFTTGGPAATTGITVASTNPLSAAGSVCPTATINATFNVASGMRLDPASVNTTSFTVTGPAPASTPVTASSVALDFATGRIATFTPAAPLTTGVTYTATLRGGATGIRDLSIPPNGLVNNYVWTFTVGSTGNCGTTTPPTTPPSIPLGSAAAFGIFGGSAGMTNQGVLTVINGSIGTTATATSSITGFHDTGGDIYTETPLNRGSVNGRIYSCAVSTTGPTSGAVNATSCSIATTGRSDAQAAYGTLAGQPAGSDPGAGNLAGLVLAPGTYTAAGGSFRIQGGDLTLDGQGNANAVWVFQMATTLTVGGPGAALPQSVNLINGAQAGNVFWQVGSAATINAGGGGTMSGTIISQAGVTISTAGNLGIATLNGRALSLGASVTVVNTVINLP